MASVLAEALSPGGRLVIKSDIRDYLEAMVAAFGAEGRFVAAGIPEDLPRTDRERRLSAKGMPTYGAGFVRTT